MIIDSHYEEKRDDFLDNAHRAYIGGMWKEMGELQFDFLVKQGLQPSNSLIDIGCGSLRGGLLFIEYLDNFQYFGTDINPTLIQLGIEKELNHKLKRKINEDSFIVSDDFNFNFKVENFDFGVAISLFTHLSQPKIVDCLKKLRPKFLDGCLFATFFINLYGNDVLSLRQKDGIVSHSDRDPFHYTVQQIENMAEQSGWKMRIIEDFEHPRNQKMVKFDPRI